MRPALGGKRRPSRIVGEILEALPDTPDVPRVVVDTSDRHAVRRHIAAKLRRT